MSLEIVDLDESSTIENAKEFEPPKRKYNDLPYLRKDFIQLMKPMKEKLANQQRQVDQGSEQVQLLLGQMGKILHERATLLRRVAEIKEFFNDKQNKRYKINMTKKEMKEKFDKCDNILETTINHKDLIKADVLNNMALCAQQKNELTMVENEYRTLSSVVNNSVSYSVKEKIVQLNTRLENFRVLKDEDFQEKLNSLEAERNNLLIKLMEKEKQEEKAKRKYKQELKLIKEGGSQDQIDQDENDEPRKKKSKSKDTSRATERDVEIIREKNPVRKTKHKRNARSKTSRVNDDEDYSDYDEKDYKGRRNEMPKKMKRMPQTTRDTVRTRKSTNRRAFNADSDDNYDNEGDHYRQVPREKPSKGKRRALSPKPQALKKILDEEIEEDVKPKKSNRPRSVTTKKMQKRIADYDEDINNVSKSKTQKRQNGSPRSVSKTSQKSTSKTSRKGAKKRSANRKKA